MIVISVFVRNMPIWSDIFQIISMTQISYSKVIFMLRSTWNQGPVSWKIIRIESTWGMEVMFLCSKKSTGSRSGMKIKSFHTPWPSRKKKPHCNIWPIRSDGVLYKTISLLAVFLGWYYSLTRPWCNKCCSHGNSVFDNLIILCLRKKRLIKTFFKHFQIIIDLR